MGPNGDRRVVLTLPRQGKGIYPRISVRDSFSFSFVNLVLPTGRDRDRGELFLLLLQAPRLFFDECFFDLHTEMPAGGFSVGQDFIADL